MIKSAVLKYIEHVPDVIIYRLYFEKKAGQYCLESVEKINLEFSY